MTEIATEASHWYRPDGTPCHTIIGKNGKERSTRITDARKLGLVPSVTKVIRDVLAAPGLVEWKINEAIMCALTLPRHENETDQEFIWRVKEDSKDRSRKAAERGSALHTSIERAIQGKPHTLHQKHVQAIVEALRLYSIDLYAGEAEKSFAHGLGYGGKVDVFFSDGQTIDFKSKDKIEDGKKLAYDEHVIQLAAYQHGLHLPPGPAYSVFVGVDDAQVVVHEWDEDEILRALEMFRRLLGIWYLKNNMDVKE